MHTTVSSQGERGWNLSEVQALNLRQFRNSHLSNKSYLLMLIPIIGWLALGCMKVYAIKKHMDGERVLREANFDNLDTDQKITTISNAINVSGQRAWQYRLEKARLHLIKGENQQAMVEVNLAKMQIGKPYQTGHYNVRGKRLVTFLKPREYKNYVDGNNVIKITYRSGEEALLNAAILAANKKYEDAYEAYNELVYYNSGLSEWRKHQWSLANKMQDEWGFCTSRGREIVTKEFEMH
ncbi:MAG: hypothetical protein Tsb0021_17550 [Chlamydiales bacterium]